MLNGGKNPPNDIPLSSSQKERVAAFESERGPSGLSSTSTVMARSGETQPTSAASVVMFGNDKKHKVIWRAP